jgi:hypothetical protein
VRIVHAADVHLDTPFRRHDADLRQRLQQAGRDAFSHLVALTLEEQADALLIAGDLFDNDWLTIATERVLTRELARLTDAGITVVYSTGNHDPGRINYRAAQIDWPSSNFHLHASRTPRRVPVHRGGERVGWVVTAGHQTTHESTNLASTFPPAPGPQAAVGLLHADVGGAQGTPDDEAGNVYAPAALADLDSSYDYWALGHIHKRQRLREDSPAWYPGNLQGRDFGETGAKGALVVDLNPPEPPHVSFRPLAPVRWERLTITDLGEAHAIGDVQMAVRTAFEGLVEADRYVLPEQAWLLRVELTGPCPLATLLRSEEERDGLAEYLGESLGALDVEVRDVGLVPPIDLSRHVGQRHVLGEALDLIEQASDDDAILSRLAPSELALGGEQADENERLKYLRELLAGLDSVAAERLLRRNSA